MTAGHLDLKVSRFAFGPAIIVQFTGAVSAYGSQVVLARWLGVAQFGTFSAVFSIAAIAGLIATLGLTGAASRFVPVALRDGDLTAARHYSGAALAACIAGGAVLGVITGLLSLVLYETSAETALWLAVLVVGTAVVHFGSDVGRAAGRNISTYGASITLRPVVLMCAVVVAGAFGWASDVPRALALTCVASAVVIAVQLYSLSTAIGARALVPRAPAGDWARRAPFFLLFSGIGLVATQVDLLVVAAVLPPTDAGVYAAASKLALAVGIAAVAINTVLAPKIASAKETQLEDVSGLVRTAGRRVLLVGSLVAAPMILVPGLILAAFGAEFIRGAPELVILAAGQVGVLVLGQGGTVLLYFDRERLAAGCVAVGVVVMAIATLIGALWGGLLFAAIAKTCAVIGSGVLVALASQRVVGVRPYTW